MEGTRNLYIPVDMGSPIPAIWVHFISRKASSIITFPFQRIFCIVQSITSPKAEPLKQWLANIGAERIRQMQEVGSVVKVAREEFENLYNLWAHPTNPVDRFFRP